MKIANKISLLVLFLLLALAVNTWIGLRQLLQVGHELREMANKDFVLAQISTSITQRQLEKAILFERMLNAAEELSFEEVSGPRQKYLFDLVKSTKKGFDQITNASALDIIEGKKIIQRGIDAARSKETRKELTSARGLLERIEKSHIAYDALVGVIFEMISRGNYQLSFEDLDKIQKKEREVSRELESLLKEIQKFIQKSLIRAEEAEVIAKRVLWVSFFITLLLSMIIAVVIIRSIAQPLKRLEHAARQISEGYFAVHLDDSSKDEIGQVSRAFNTMARKIADAQAELKSINQELAENLQLTNSQKRDLEKVNKELDAFVYTVSHDIGAPLRGIAFYAASLEDKYHDRLDAKGKEFLSGIRKGADQLNEMIEDLLSLTRISRIKNPYEEVSMKELIMSIRERLEFNLKEAGVDFQVQESMPTIMCDRVKLGEVFFNLVNNAIKFSSRNNKETPRVEVGYNDRGDAHEFFVKDNGIGIDPQYHAHVFDIFKRLNRSSEYEGTGTGLAIVQNVIHDHGGKIWIESQLGQGATFFFTIPKSLKQQEEPV